MKFPGDTDRLSIVGATGSGKTMAGLFHLSRRNIDTKPWIVYDFKFDELINEIPHAQSLPLNAKLPEQPGVYIVRPRIGQDELVDEHMMRIWEAEDIGVYVDEGYMVGNRSNGFRALLTQGRTKHIPMIVNSQRPVYMDRFVFTESQYFQIFRLQHDDDIINAQKFIPYDISKRLPQFHSYYYDAVSDRMIVLSPVPDRNAILDTFDTKLQRLRKVI
jgi:hypothetical protein